MRKANQCPTRNGPGFRSGWFPWWSLRLPGTLPLVALVLAALLLPGGPASAQSNNAPVFDPATVTLSVAENTATGTNIGAPVTATDADNDTLTYTLGGYYAPFFSIVSTTGQIRTYRALDHEEQSSFRRLTVTVSDGNGGTAEATVNIRVTDVDEPTPSAPTVSVIPGNPTSILVSWTAPANTEPLLSYDLRWSENPGSWEEGPKGVVGLTQVIHNLSAIGFFSYAVQVRARTDEFTSGWSPSSARVSTGRFGDREINILPGENVDPRCNLPLTGATNLHLGFLEVTATESRVTMSWERDPYDAVLGGGHCIWRAENSLEYQLLGFVPERRGVERESWVDDSVLPSTRYFYRIRAVEPQGMSYGLRSFSVLTGTELPGFTATASRTAVTLRWDDPGDDTVTGYRILRRVNWGSETTLTGSIAASATSYVDRRVSPGTAYAYRVQVRRGTQFGHASQWVTALTLPRVSGSSSSVSERANRDLQADTSTTGLLRVGESVTGVIASDSDVDWFAVDLAAGENYFLRLRYDGERLDGNGALVIGGIRDAAGDEIDHRSVTLHCCYKSHGPFNPDRTGRYYLPVSQVNEIGITSTPLAYTLELHSDPINEYIGGQDIVGAAPADVGQWTSGAFHDPDRRDSYRVELCGGRRYAIPLFHNLTADADGVVRRPYLSHVGPTNTGPGGFYYTEPYVLYAQRTGTHVLYIDREPGDDPESIVSNNGRLARDSAVLGRGAYRFYVEQLDEGEDTSRLQPVSEAPDTDLPANTGTAGLLPFDKAVTGSIGSAGDVDWFAVRFNERHCNRMHWFDLKGVDTGDGTLEDPYIVGLYDALGQYITYNDYPGPHDTADDNSGVDRNARQAYLPSAPGVYYIAVRANGIGTGTYTLTLRDVTDTSISEENGVDYAVWHNLGETSDFPFGNLAAGVPATGRLDSDEIAGGTPTDLWHLSVQSGRRYRLHAQGEPSLPYPVLSLWPITSGDDFGDILGSWLDFVDDFDDIHRSVEFQAASLLASRHDLYRDTLLLYRLAWHAHLDVHGETDARGFGDYTLSLTDITDTENQSELGSPNTTGTVAVGGSVMGTIDVFDDVDWFEVEGLQIGRTYRFRMKGVGSEGGTLTDPYMKLYQSRNGVHNDFIVSPTEPISRNNDTCASSKDSVLTFTTDEPGPYWVEANTPGEGTGTYTIEVEEYDGTNTPATGAPAITGTPQADETLTANIAAICDSDGMGTVHEAFSIRDTQFAYQWLADGTAIAGATNTTYTPVAGDVGKTISVTVSFTDNAGHSESLTSQATAAVTAAQSAPGNNPAMGAPAITGTVEVGETLTADTSGVSDPDGLENVTFAYQWLANGSELGGATGQSYTVGELVEGQALSVRVTFTDDAGNEETLTSAPTAAVPVAALTLDSATVDGASLTLTYSELLNELVDLPETAFTVTVNGSAVTVSDSSVSGSAVTLTLASAVAAGDAVTVGYEQPEGNRVIGDLRGRVAESFSGQAVTNDTPLPPLTASADNVPASHDGSAEFAFRLHFSEEFGLSYVTLRDHAFTVTGGSVRNARRLNPPSNVGWEITVEPSGDGTVTIALPPTTDCEAQGAICAADGRMLSNETTVTVPGPDSQQSSQQQEAQQNNPATGSPVISGTVRVGETLSGSTAGIADADGLTNVSYAYQWLADDAVIAGATGSTYTLVSGDQGKAIKARVSFTDDAGNAEALTSVATATVTAANNPATGSPVITGTAQVGQTLSVSTAGIADADGLTNVSYAYQWLADDAVIAGATGSTYTLAAADQGKAIKARVSFTDDAGNAETLTSAATAAVAPPPLTASASQVPASHDGSAEFTFQLHFSEEFGLSYVTLRDHAFTVTGGSVRNARRLNPPSNVGWEITVEPSGDGTVTIDLPVTTDCEAQGAICIDDGRMLSNLTTVTVAGP
ncbi:MAG: hypothetical protein F4X72_14565 [Dehalococcoidia bacterium]|nr:hypothetical protein [Dehalococcoidia bacterium]